MPSNPSLYVLLAIYYNDDQYEYLYKITQTDYITGLVNSKGDRIIYLATTDCSVCQPLKVFKERPTDVWVTYEGSDCDSDDYEDYPDDRSDKSTPEESDPSIAKALKQIASSHISIRLITPEHWDCVGTKVCGCGCNKLHSGGDDVCEPYPYGSVHF